MYIYPFIDISLIRQLGTSNYKQTDRQTDRHINRQTNKHTDRQTDRQTDI